jgi:hypothetical protein
MTDMAVGDTNAASPWRWSELRLIPAVDRDASVVAFIKTRVGRAILFCFMLLLANGDHALMAIVGLGAAVAYLPRYRTVLMVFAAPSIIIAGPWLAGEPAPTSNMVIAVFGVVAFTAAVTVIARRTGRRGPFARPVLTLMLMIGALATLGSVPALGATVRSFVWSATIPLAAATWFIAYAVVNATGRQPKNTLQHLGMLRPFWGSTNVPFGKGAAFLAKFEACNADELAVTQIKAAKLLIWAKLLMVAGTVFNMLVHVQAGVPKLEPAIAALAAGHPSPRMLSIAAIPVGFIDSLIALTVMGHTFVACCRCAGFRIPRNTYRPLEARSIAEFWNRYYYYFKELLVDFFYLPTFAKMQGWSPRTRMIVATFSAAGLGNYLYHFIRDIDLVRTLGPAQAIIGSQTSVFYCLLLSTGIATSQLTAAPRAQSRFARIMSSLRVLGFYCLVSLFAYEGRTLTLFDHFHFLFYVLGAS